MSAPESHPPAPPLHGRILGCLYGGLIGDAMGAPAEGKTYQEIADAYGELTEFTGAGTDDTAIRLILIDAIMAGSLAGAYRGVEALPTNWVASAAKGAGSAYDLLTRRFITLLERRRKEAHAQARLLDRLLESS